jgi:hypothetical protein
VNVVTSPPSTSWWRPLHRRDRLAIGLMVIIPLVIFGVPALFGHPAIAQDNLIQNFPLRVLTGQQLRSGHLPLLNPLANSGTPLLGGMNAGSLFPLTMLFVALPAVLAWVLNLVAVYAGAALGMFALLRWHGLRTLSSSVAAFVFAYTGAMIGQMVHLGVVQGFALMPWMILALFALAKALQSARATTSWRSLARPMLPSALGVSALWGLAFLSGEPRAIAELELVTIVVAATLLVVRGTYQLATWRTRIGFGTGVILATGWGALIGLVQILPGWKFITQSQRASISYTFFGAGSLPVRWTSMLFDQTILGGNGIAHQPSFFTNYNLPEVTGYTGILALVAVCGFLTRLTRSGWRGGERNHVVYFVIVVVGLFAAWESFTPLGHLFQQIPLFGNTRLQSRNIALVDLGAAALLGWWLDRLEARDFAGAGLLGWRRLVTLTPAFITIALSGAMMFAGVLITVHLGAWTGTSNLARYEFPTLVIQVLIGGSIFFALWFGLGHHRLVRWLVVITTVDVLVFLMFSATGFLAGHTNIMPSRASATSLLGGYGRFALVDPSGRHLDDFESLGSPNMNVFTEIPSIQGYGSLIESVYGNVTASHPLFSLDPCQLANGSFIQLRLASVAVSNGQLMTPLSLGYTPALRCLPLKSHTRNQRYFGQMLAVRNITIQGAGGQRVSTGSVSAQLLDATGHPFGPVIYQLGEQINFFNFDHVKRQASGVQILAPSGAKIYSTTVAVAGAASSTYELNTPFQQALSSPLWHLSATVGTFAIFKSSHVRPIAWFGTNKSTSKIIVMKNSGWGDSWITVRVAYPTVLKRSQAWLAGWRATALNTSTHQVQSLVIVRSGLIQQVVVPPGTWEVHFHYHAPYIETGLGGTAAGLLAWFAALAYSRGWLGRRRNSKVRA